MKSNLFLTILVGVSLLASVWLCLLYIKRTGKDGELQQLEREVIQMNNHYAKMQAIASVCAVYSRTNSSIDPILESVGMNPKAERAAAKPSK